jgi:hypothetical protein
MTLKTRFCLGLLAIMALILAEACQSGNQFGSEEQLSHTVSPSQYSVNNTDENSNSGITINKPVMIAEGTTELIGDGTKETIRVWLMKGKEVTDPNPGAFQGTFLQGEFEVVATASDEKELARFGLNDAFVGRELSFRKDKPFMLQFDDYNSDGNPDFTIGQWGSSNGNFYSLLTIGPNGFRVLEKDIYSSDHRSSIRYRKVGDLAFVNQYYDQKKGAMDVIYRWKEGAFIPETPVEAKVVHAAGMVDGETMKTVKINDPASWVVKTIPDDNDQNVPSNIKKISIMFDRDMDSKSLTPSSITIVEGKHGHTLQEGYLFSYDSATKTLTLSTKDPESDFGTSNTIDITLSKDIKNIKGEKMGVNVQFGFAVP